MTGPTDPPGSGVDLLLAELGRRLTGDLAFDAGPGSPALHPSHPLALEIEALRAGGGASLPYPAGTDVAWFTIAPTHDGLRRAMADLRAWLMPSLAWEHPGAPVILPGAARGAIGARIAAVSPGGYYRWHTSRAGLDPALARLRQMRRLDRRRPVHVATARPGLFELRHRFQVALTVGDRAAAAEALSAIDADRLDGAVNTGFMRLRFHAAFADDADVIRDPGLPLLLQMRLPSRVREAVLAAHHRHLLRPLEDAGDLDGALARYETALHDLLAGQIAAAAALWEGGAPGVDVGIRRLAAYRCAASGDEAALARVGAGASDDPVVANLLARSPSAAPPSGPAGSGAPPATGAPAARPAPPTNPPRAIPAAPVEAVRAAIVAGTRVPPGWSDLPEAFRQRRWPDVDLFLARAAGTPARDAPSAPEIADALLEIAAECGDAPGAGERFDGVLLAAVDLSGPALPRPEHRPVYAALLSIWSERRRGSSYPPDGDLMLVLAGAVLALDGPARADEAVGALRSWWDAWPVRTRLPWLLAAVDLLTEVGAPGGAAHGAATSLWVDGAELLRRDPSGASRGERALWRRIGARLGFDTSAVAEYLGAPDLSTGEDGPDPLLGLPARRVAIVTLEERAGNAARDLLAARISAEVQVVAAHVAGAATDSAKSADVILFAWAANKHAVFRAFDGVRERIEYVSGKGSSSIVAALERWAGRTRGAAGP